MGVPGLQTFMQQYCPSSIRKVSLVEMINAFHKQNPGIAEPILVIDGLNCMTEIYGGLDWLCGGQWLEFLQALENFVKSLQDLGLKLVFFFDGSTPISKRDEWYKRRTRQLEETVQIYNLLKAKCNVPQSLFQLPASMGTLIRMALKYICKVPVYTVVNGDCDQIVATFAKQNNCLAVLTQDSDYVIYNTVPFVSISKLNLKTMETVMYDRDLFCSRMNITLAQLPLLACLKGNDYVSRESLMGFHKQIVRQYNADYRVQQGSSFSMKILASLLLYIKSLHLEPLAENSDPRLLSICRTVFGTTSMLDNLRNGLTMYAINYSRCKLYRNPFEPQPPSDCDTSNPEGIFDYFLEKSIENDMAELFYNTLILGICELGPCLEDEKNTSFSPTVLIYRPIRSRLYDLIFHFRAKHMVPSVTLKRTGVQQQSKDYTEEWWVNSRRIHLESDKVHRSPIEGAIPDLLKLWKETDPSTEQLKWKTTQACLNLSQSTNCLKEIPDKFKLLCMMMNYLIQCPNVPLESWEVDAFLVQCVLPKADDIEWIKKLNVKSHDHHAVHLAAVFYRGTTQFQNVLTICGEPYPIEKSMPWHYFDGKRFHHCYTSLKSGVSVEDLCSHNVESLKLFDLLKKSTYENLND